MRISIAMATYNGAKYLQDQLDSFLYQSRQPDELVVCDDGSTDGTLEVLETFCRQAPFAVHVYRNETNLGCTKNFEKAMSLCTGEILFLSDQDDVWFCNKIDIMAATLVTRPEIMLLNADLVLTDDSLNPSPYTALGQSVALAYGSENVVHGCSTAFRCAWRDFVLPIPAVRSATHDGWIHRLASLLGVRMQLDIPLQYYRRHDHNTSNWLASRMARLTVLDVLRAYGLRDVTDGYRSELEVVEATRSRLAASTDTLKMLGLSNRQAAAISTLDRRIKAINDRITLMAVPRARRLPRILEMWAQGYYRQFAGWKSAVKDMLRP